MRNLVKRLVDMYCRCGSLRSHHNFGCLLRNLEVLSVFSTVGSPSKTASPSVSFLLREAFPILVIDILIIGHQHIEALILDAYLTSESVGIFSSVRRIIGLAGFPLLLLNTTVRPFIAQLYRQKNEQQLNGLLRGSATIAVIIALPIYVGLAVFAEPILSTLFGPKFGDGAWALRILTLSGLVFVASGCCSMVLLMTGNQRVTMWTIMVYSLVYLLLAPLAAQSYGMEGAAIAGALFVIFGNVTLVFAAHYFTGILSTATYRPSIVRNAWHSFVSRGAKL